MGDRIVIYREHPDSENAEAVAERLKAKGVEVLETLPDTLLVSGKKRTISDVVSNTAGWNASPEVMTPPPDLQYRAKKAPPD